MAQFIGFSHEVEVNGQTVLALVAGVTEIYKERILNILAKYNIIDPQPHEWYKQQDWLDAFREISETIGKYTLFSIGKSIPDNADFPSEINTLEKALRSIDIAYKMNHRKGDIGYYKLTEFNEIKRTAVMECKNPYPCHFDRGIITSMVRKFRPFDSIKQEVELMQGKKSRLDGSDTSFYVITW